MSYSNLPKFLIFHVLYISMSRGRNYIIEQKQERFPEYKLWNKVLHETRILLGLRRRRTTERVGRILSLCVSYTILTKKTPKNFKPTFSKKMARQTAKRQV